MLSQPFKELSKTYPGWTRDIEKVQNFFSVRSATELFEPTDLAHKLDVSPKVMKTIFSHLCEAKSLFQKSVNMCPTDNCYNNELTLIDEGTAECDSCDKRYEVSSAHEKVLYELKSVPEKVLTNHGGQMFQGLLNSHVDLVKKDGSVVNNIPASVQTNRIFIDDTSVKIENGDFLINTLPNGVVDKFEVIDHGFKPAFAGITAHYQVRVKKSGTQEKVSTNITYNNYLGANGRVNNNSTDQSTNTVNYQQNQIFDDMKSLTGLLEQSVATQVNAKIEELQKAKDSKGFLNTYKEIFNLAGDHVDFITKLMPMITVAKTALSLL